MAQFPLIALQNISLTFGGKPLFEKLSVAISKGDKTCLAGRNGSGKSTLLKIISGQIEVDRGDRFVQPGIRISCLAQDVMFQPNQTPKEFVMQSGCAAHEAEAVLDSLKVNPDIAMAGFSGGECRRVALAQALAGTPDILLLDEPTNHLDLPAIEWLENRLQQYAGALLTISHDRMFLERISNSCLWLDHGLLYRHDKGFRDFSAWTDQLLLEEERQLGKLDTKLAQELEWLHRGVTARRRRNQGRLRQLNQLREDKRNFMANQPGNLKLGNTDASPGSKLVVEARNISKTLENKLLIQNFSVRVMYGDKIGIVGPNGAGKTTLVRMLAGALAPDAGTVRLGASINLIYHDQLRKSLNPDQTPWQNLCETGGEYVNFQGQSRHVASYLKDFLFRENQLHSPVRVLSGGEKNRLALAKALTKPGNFLILDEPTNDLDMDTLDLLIDTLGNYTGTLIIISHDRDFLDKLVTSIIAVEGEGIVRECAGGYQDYLRQFPLKEIRTKNVRTAVKKEKALAARISYKEKREYELLPAQISKLAAIIAKAEACLADSAFYNKNPEKFNETIAGLMQAREELDQAETRWLELDEQVSNQKID